MFHLVIDALEELSKLNKKFKFDMVDIWAIGSTLDAFISIWKEIFGVGSVQIWLITKTFGTIFVNNMGW
jgi:hypothetical protein